MNNLIKHIFSISLFISITIYIFNPVFFENKELKQHDIEQWKYSANESIEFRKSNNEEALWSNSMFSGMPGYLIDVKWSNQIVSYIHKIFSFFFPHPVNILLISFISFYIMMLCFNVRPEIAAFGSIAFTLSSYMLVGIGAGHNARIGTIALMPLIIAGVHLCINNKRNLGFIITALALALQLRLNHLQITYYTLIILIFYGIGQIIYYHNQNRLNHFFKRLGLLIIAASIAIGTFFGQIWSVLEYSNESIRGKSELLSTNTSGLDKGYAFQYSNGIFEPLTLFVPHILGGSSQETLSRDSNLGKALRKNNIGISQINTQLRKVPTYWGNQPLTAPYYAGAISLFLLIFGLIILKSHEKNWIVALLIISILLSMGSNLSFFNNFIFDYFPGYNKFRSVTFIIIISIFCLSLISSLAIEKFINNFDKYKSHLLNAFYYTIGIYITLYLVSFVLSFTGSVDTNFTNYPSWFTEALIKDRKSLYNNDILKGIIICLVFLILSMALIYKKIGNNIYLIAIITLILLDHMTFNNYILKDDKSCELYNDCSYSTIKNLKINLSESDQYILENNINRKRVYNLQNTFNEARTSYFHSSIGGYHGAKMRRYQDLIERGITNERNKLVNKLQNKDLNFSDLNILNMLNTGFIKFGDNKTNVVANNYSNGNVWFVSELIATESPNEEINTLISLNTKDQAVIDIKKFNLSNTSYSYSKNGNISLIDYSPKKLIYKSSNKSQSFAVFSEMYYPQGWKVFVNGNEKKLVRVNYVLRGLELEPGDNTIEMSFNPKSYSLGNLIVKGSNIILLILIFIILFIEFRKFIHEKN